MKRYDRLFHSAKLLLAVVVALLTFAVTAHAVQTITTPNAVSYTYSIPINSYSTNIVPVAGQPVHVMCAQTTLNYRGVSEVALLRIAGSFVEWTGLESPGASPATITSGYSGTTGAHIAYCDYAHSVDLQVVTPDELRVHNGPTVSPAAVNVTLIW